MRDSLRGAELNKGESVVVVDGRHGLATLQILSRRMESEVKWTRGHIRVALLVKKDCHVMTSW